MIQWVYERAAQTGVKTIIVATDSQEILEAVHAFGGTAQLTSPDHDNGTSRIAEVARTLDSDVIINVQGDEPCIHPAAIQAVIDCLVEDPSLEMGTLAQPLTDARQVFDPNVVKLVLTQTQRALYFSRAPIPYQKHVGMKDPFYPTQLSQSVLKHIGVYGYRRDFLLKYVTMPACELEQREGLEQLRALYMGASIGVRLTSHPAIGVDTPDDIGKAEDYLSKEENVS